LNDDLPDQLAARLQLPLPGWKAQAAYQPDLSFGRHQGPAPANATPAAVLILLYPHHDAWHLPLIVRPADMPAHAGQVSLPGGVIEPGEDSRQAALREFVEELGASADDIQLLGPLSEIYLFASNFTIAPWVGAMQAAPRWSPSTREVARLLEVPLGHLRDPANTRQIQRNQRGLSYTAPCFCWESERIWGATSMILAEFVAALADYRL
jgi:8-oxo-dGTP pyrophosphatase MutT (NUDIX family)